MLNKENPDIDHIVEAWSDNQKTSFSKDESRLIQAIYSALSEGQPLSAEQASESSGIPLRSVGIAYRYMRRRGADFDADGKLIGNALTLRPTPHKFRVGGQQLYAWCALDTMFIPGLIGNTAEVESTCGATGEPIRLRISPTGIEAVEPADAVLSVTIPGVSAACEPGQGKGGESASCHAMNYYVSRQAAESHLGPNTDVAIVDVETAWELAHRVWVEPYIRALGESKSLEPRKPPRI
jgi:alkylmercury lyase